MRYTRNSVLRARGEKPATALSLRIRAKRAEATIADIRATVAAVNVPNGTTLKIARLVA